MKKLYKLIFTVALLLSISTVNATTWTVTNSGFTFSPASITINLGDTVMFSLGGGHNVVEVTQTTWNANGNTSNGGFTLPFGGGMLIPTMVKTYYYVCNPHASLGMKGQIIVNNSTGIPTPVAPDFALRFSPNPSSTQTLVHTGYTNGVPNSLKVFDLTGKMVMKEENISDNHFMDVSSLSKGIYFVEFKAEAYRRTSKLVVSGK